MEFEFDPAKDAANIAKHGLSLDAASRLDWNSAVTWLDRGQKRRVISLRHANEREEIRYART